MAFCLPEEAIKLLAMEESHRDSSVIESYASTHRKDLSFDSNPTVFDQENQHIYEYAYQLSYLSEKRILEIMEEIVKERDPHGSVQSTD